MPDYKPMKERVQELLEMSADAHQMIFTEEHYLAFLSKLAGIHTTANNAALQYFQNPDITYVNGYEQWKEYGRQVKSGETGIRILAPAKTTFTRETEQGKETVTLPIYKQVYVFDISQTYGKQFHENEIFQKSDTFIPFYYSSLKNAAAALSVSLPHTPEQFYDKENTQVYADMIHKIASTKLIRSIDPTADQFKAQSITYAVCQYYVLPGNTSPDVSAFATDREISELRQTLDTIKKGSREIIHAIDQALIDLYQTNDRTISIEAIDILGVKEQISEKDALIYMGLLEGMASRITADRPRDKAQANMIRGYLTNLEMRMPHGDLREATGGAAKSPTASLLKERMQDIYKTFMQYHDVLPDSSVSQFDLKKYGYTYHDMLPLNKERAEELFKAGHSIYRLYEDNTEAEISHIEELHSVDGYLGIQRSEWDASPERKLLQNRAAEQDSSQKDAILLYGKNDYFGVYKRNDGQPSQNFSSVAREDYHPVHVADLPADMDASDIVTRSHSDEIETPYHVADGDILVLRKDGQTDAYLFDSYEFEPQPDFLTPPIQTEADRDSDLIDQSESAQPTIQNPQNETAPAYEEPQVQIVWSTHDAFHTGQEFSLSDADQKILALIDSEAGINADNCEVAFTLHYQMDNVPYQYNGVLDLTERNRGITAHIQSHAKEQLESDHLSSDEQRAYQFVSETLVPYLKGQTGRTLPAQDRTDKQDADSISPDKIRPPDKGKPSVIAQLQASRQTLSQPETDSQTMTPKAKGAEL